MGGTRMAWGKEGVLVGDANVQPGERPPLGGARAVGCASPTERAAHEQRLELALPVALIFFVQFFVE